MSEEPARDDDPTRSRVSTAFKDLANETRLTILLALWEAYEPLADDNALPFSTLREHVGTRDSGQFNYHLSKLTGHFVRQTDDGYELTDAALRLIRGVIAGSGIEDPTMPSTPIDVACSRCGARPVEVGYHDEAVHLVCTSCEGFIGGGTFPAGTIGRFEFEPAGLAGRTPEEVFAASWLSENAQNRMCQSGICPECSGRIERSVMVCDEHAPGETAVCPNCERRDAVRVRYVCSVCKYWNEGPATAVLIDHPAIAAFYDRHGIDLNFHVTDIEAARRTWATIWEWDQELVSVDPVEVVVTVPCESEVLEITLDGDLTVVDVAGPTRTGVA